ncbi:transglycosylase family protein [Streptomyces spectabilis]|uniref:LysM peptidoglycan-binding domain-containing protein n=1 Tax=Streptomyces spectabilis TaxID=68270 RepID=A0A5P2XBN5_STRST|nr:transglycosylase family protein [Streptomyces spectabilis]MBB5107757.1 LysM repeat protein [Streptomyces spectabilis]MCI3903195.1 transglycosylase family protein [Streptomyces spectabilis]QEV60430.1 LysM peptidoglycan-binding domain-containing protein [Streptomyces spectabilis]GGV38476.1 peptidoglycan-binding protein LysM [Streptomyces spectabilis]
MLSGQGRHRRPRQVPAILVTAGVTGSAIAIPLLGASGASAADAGTWDKVAECESGGAWSAKGSGYYGGLQLTQDTWEQYGGLSYAPTADQASRSQQIHVAEKVLADRGPDAWPNCAPAAGLAKGGEAAAVDPGLPSAPPSSSDSDDSAESSEPSDSSRSGKEKDAEKDAKEEREAAGSDRSEKAERPGSSTESRDKTHDSGNGDDGDDGATQGGKSAEDGSREGGGKHRKPAGDADKSGADDSASSQESEESEASQESEGAEPGADDAADDRPAGRHRGGSAADDAPSGDTGPGRHASRGEARDVPAAERPSGTYTVRSGDNLSAIADSHDLDGGWSGLYAGNKKTVGSDPDLILPGQRLELSAEDKGATAGKSSEK